MTISRDVAGLQTQSNTNPLYNGPFDAIKKIYSQHGIRGIFKGQCVTFLREATGYGIYFMVYEKLVQREMAKKNIRREQINPLNAVLYGATAGYAVKLLVDELSMLAHLLFLVVGGNIPHRHD